MLLPILCLWLGWIPALAPVHAAAADAPSGEPIRVGVLHSLSGTMAISETTLKDTMEMLIEQQNEKGGVLGCELEAVVEAVGATLPELNRLSQIGDHKHLMINPIEWAREAHLLFSGTSATDLIL